MPDPATPTARPEVAVADAVAEVVARVARVHAALAPLNFIAGTYCLSAAELGRGLPISSLPNDYPGAHGLRALGMVALVAKAEVATLLQVLVEAKLVTQERYQEVFEAQCADLARRQLTLMGWSKEAIDNLLAKGGGELQVQVHQLMGPAEPARGVSEVA
jgi:hypothetical protein